jgi:hypothetical protein
MKSGYPVIIVEGTTIKQAQFTKQGLKPNIWPIPLSIVYYVNVNKESIYVLFEVEEMKLNLSETIEFFVVNSESQSYC